MVDFLSRFQVQSVGLISKARGIESATFMTSAASTKSFRRRRRLSHLNESNALCSNITGWQIASELDEIAVDGRLERSRQESLEESTEAFCTLRFMYDRFRRGSSIETVMPPEYSNGLHNYAASHTLEKAIRGLEKKTKSTEKKEQRGFTADDVR